MNKKRKDNSIIGLSFLYNTAIGRILLKILVNNKVANEFMGFILNRRISCLFIKSFIKKNNINIEEYENEKYKSFNDFFIRRIKKEKRPIIKDNNIFTSCCDSFLTCYKITDELLMNIKNSTYDVNELLKDKALAQKYKNGYALVFRLTPSNYHRYHFIDSGVVVKTHMIKGKFHTVNPIVYDKYKVFHENNRCVTLIKTDNFDEVTYVEVGALLVGKIVNLDVNKFNRGDEKGYFKFGGSTVIMLVKDNIVEIDEEIMNNSINGIETSVKCNQKIGIRICK